MKRQEETIERLDGQPSQATYIRHLRTLTGPAGNHEVDMYRLSDGTEIECISPSGDGRAIPLEVDPTSDHYPGHAEGE